ncbi:hypothetical protein FJT64_007862 [Amphibalanus amphitrite]|uniref:Uncharacterized protein n=1 Tax=Amphibalanus amphitrite TaxID=1232801 RepID=A0A6A4VNJ9_AMPAM|nr:hypothetical protein FJT64_007862 [Amphibalanus amphitrite]
MRRHRRAKELDQRRLQDQDNAEDEVHVEGAVKQNPALSVTEKDIANAIGKWLVNSRDREGYRTARQATNSSGGGSGGADTSNGGGGGSGVKHNADADEAV